MTGSKDKRRMERMEMDLPSRVSVLDGQREKNTIELKMRNVSAGGVFFETGDPLPCGASVQVDLVIPLAEYQKVRGKETLVQVTGEVVRVGSRGMAVRFDGDYRMAAVDVMSEARVYIVGPNRLQNRLLSMYLENTARLKCEWSVMLEPSMISGDGLVRKNLVILDCAGAEPSRLSRGTEFKYVFGMPRTCVALMNFDPVRCSEKEMIDAGFHGVFCHDDSPERFPEGIEAMLNGELCFSKKALCACLLADKKEADSGSDGVFLPVLTNREKELLLQLASGKSNQEIADALCISLHTVKTHFRNIFKKINVSNRFQAILWVTKYI